LGAGAIIGPGYSWVSVFEIVRNMAMQYARDLDKRRKRFLFTLCASIIILAFIVLSVINYLEGDLLEEKINLIVMGIMLGGLFTIYNLDADTAVYRATHLFISLSFAYCVYIGAGKGTVLQWSFIMPLLFFYFFGTKEGSIWVINFLIMIFIMLLISYFNDLYSYDIFYLIRFFAIFIVISVIGYGLESSRHTFGRLLNEKNKALLQEKEQLEEAMANIRILTGLLPICSVCKRIRDDQGYWNQLEAYLSEHSDIIFSHSICPECAKRLYPEQQE
jgi:hypothetical protein